MINRKYNSYNHQPIKYSTKRGIFFEITLFSSNCILNIMFDLFGWIGDQINSYINFYYVVLSIINKLLECFSKIKIDFADIFAQPPDPAEQLQKDMQENSKKVEEQFNKGLEDFQNIFAAPPAQPTL